MEGLIPLGVLLVIAVIGIACICLGLGHTEILTTQTSYGSAQSTETVGEKEGFLCLGHILLWPSLILGVVYAIVFLCTFLTSWGSVKAMEAFYRDTLANYEYTVTATEQIEIQGYANQEGVITDLTYQQQGMVAGERIKEMRDKTEWYNRTLRRLNSLNSPPIIGGLFHDVPDDLKPIVLGGD